MQIFEALDRYARTDEGNVAQLKGQQKEFRLRVGDWRVRFIRDEANTRRILHVLNRGEAYR
jgi:mRNA-degrading endonuclease RelE of RelBE toxin-antitoxin system